MGPPRGAARLGRGLISPYPETDRSKLDKGKVIGSALVIAGRKRRHCLILLKNRSTRLRDRQRSARLVHLASGAYAVHDFRRFTPHAVRAYNGRIDRLHGRILSRRQAIHDPIPDASPSPANEAIVASRRRSIALRQIAPRRT
jgi:hypothetical protein